MLKSACSRYFSRERKFDLCDSTCYLLIADAVAAGNELAAADYSLFSKLLASLIYSKLLLLLLTRSDNDNKYVAAVGDSD